MGEVIDIERPPHPTRTKEHLDAARARQRELRARGEGKKPGPPSKAEKEIAAAHKIANALGVDDLEELVELFEREGKAAFTPLRPAALKALAQDLIGADPKNRRDAYMRVLDMTDGKPAQQRDDDDGPKRVEYYTAALGDEAPAEPPAFSFD